MKNKKNCGEKKQCSKCLDDLPLDSFYSKGIRLDSVCKKCKKEKSRTSYLARKKQDDLKNLSSFANLICELELIKTERMIKQLDQIIGRNNVSSH